MHKTGVGLEKINFNSKKETPSDNASILLIDDSDADRTIIKQFIAESPLSRFRIVESDSLKEGAALALAHDFECIIVDHYLSDGDSIHLLNILSRHDRLDTSAVIVLTSRGDELMAARIMKSGASDYMPKEKVNAASLNRAIDNAIETNSLRCSLKRKNVELEKANQNLQQKTKEVESFYHNVSHELKTPLTAAREFSELLKDQIAGPMNDQQLEFVQICIDNCDRAAFYINSLLDVIRSDNGKLSLEKSRVNFSKKIDEIVTIMQPIASKKNIVVGKVVSDCDWYVYADAEKIHQILINLVSNAIKFTNQGGRVLLSLTEDHPRSSNVIVSVSDNGRGIHPNKLDKIFDRFCQIDSLSADNPHSLGLGLNLCQTIVEMHGGEMMVESGLGVGSTFSFTLPRWKSSDEAVIAPAFLMNQNNNKEIDFE